MEASAPTAGDTDATCYADVALLRARPGLDVLTYRVAPAQRDRLRAGMRVLVPLGRRHETALVVALRDRPAVGVATIRDVADVLDVDPIVTDELFALCAWTARYYLAPLAEVLATAVPGGLGTATARVVRLADVASRPSALRGLEQAILEHLAHEGPTTTVRLARLIARPGLRDALRSLVARGSVVMEERVRAPAARTRWSETLRLAQEIGADDLAVLARRAPRQHGVATRLRDAAERGLDVAGLSAAERVAAAALVRRGMATRSRAERYRDTRPPVDAAVPSRVLSAAQQTAVDAVEGSAGFQVFLLHGVTGSGKTEVYLQLAARTLARGRTVLALVPEIALTHQLVVQAQQRFGSAVALLHSGLAPGARWDEWRRIARGEARMVVGTRSAVFAPLAALGLVIVDEEHDAAYKQEEGLRYHGRDVAVVRAKLADVAAVLGSATPAVESYQQALDGKFRLLELPIRVEGRPLPQVDVVDLRRRETRSADDPAAASRLFSRALLDAIHTTLGRREQVLLFLNRRGFAQTLQCLSCGEPAGCPSCSVTLTLHRGRGTLLCHHCGYARPAGAACAGCGSADLCALGDGTERVEAEAQRLFPEARVARLDRDTTRRSGAHRRILDAWRSGALDILIGTQMVTKGHDVPGVTLVGVLLADVALGMPDFRAGERAFQLLTQVAGRAGRGDTPGRVVLQTYRVEHHSVIAAAAHDYAGFAPRELAYRRELGYPPFARLAILRVEGPDADATERAAASVAASARALAARVGVTVRGPAPAPLERLRGRYRWQLLLASANVRALHDVVRRTRAAWSAMPARRSLRLVVDVDPTSML